MNTNGIISLLKTLTDLGSNYVFEATPFFIVHLLLLTYFISGWYRSRNLLNRDLKELKAQTKTPELLGGIEDQIKAYSGPGREFFVRGIEESVIEKLNRHTEPLRVLGNSFVAVGLMGTLFALFALGMDNLVDAKKIIGQMSVAFSASFFGLLLTLFCNLFLLRSLRIRVSHVSVEARNRINLLSTKYLVHSPMDALYEAVAHLREYVERLEDLIQGMAETEKSHLAASHSLLTEFKETTVSVLTDMNESVTETQENIKLSSETLEKNVTAAVGDLRDSFVEISESWKADLQDAIESAELANSRLSTSTEALAQTNSEVSASLKAVTKALDRTKRLSEIVDNITSLTNGYLEQTEAQLGLFKVGLEATTEAARSIPDEWFTMLQRRNQELAESLHEITAVWKTDVLEIRNNFFTRFDKTADVGAVSSAQADFHDPNESLSDHTNDVPAFRDVLLRLTQVLETATTGSDSMPDGTDNNRALALLDQKLTRTYELVQKIDGSSGARVIHNDKFADTAEGAQVSGFQTPAPSSPRPGVEGLVNEIGDPPVTISRLTRLLRRLRLKN